MPRPRSVLSTDSSWQLGGALEVSVSADDPKDHRELTALAERFARRFNERARLAGPRGPSDIIDCSIDPSRAPGYELRVDARGVRVRAHSPEGVHWALTTLEQLMPLSYFAEQPTESLTGLRVPGVLIDDAPCCVWRGAHLDVARHFFDVATVERFIDVLSLHKLNVLHLHLTDDQGWRLEVPRWPRLTEIGATRTSSPLGHESEGRDDATAHGGFFSVADVRRLVTFAAERFITIVPEVDLPGHVQALLAAYPQFSNLDVAPGVRTRWGISVHVLNLDDATFAFCEEILAHVADLFPGPYIHIGGDECPTVEWANSPRARHRMDELALDSPEAVQAVFTRRLGDFVASLPLVERGPRAESSRRAIAWDEVLDADVPSSVVIAAWRHSSRGALAARRGHDVIMAPMQFTYLDWPQSDAASEPVALTRPPWPTTLDKVRRFSVIPPGLEDEFEHHVLGAQAQLWSEYISTPEHLDYMAFPRLSALADIFWNATSALDDSALEAHLLRLGALGVRYRHAPVAAD